MATINKAQITEFRERGVVLLKQVLDDAALALAREAFESAKAAGH